MNKSTHFETSLLWLTRLTGVVGAGIGAVGLLFAGGHASVDLFVYVGSASLVTFAPKWFYLRPRSRGVLLVTLLLGFISPITVALEEWPLSGDWVQILQCLPLVLALALAVLWHSVWRQENAT